MAIDPQILEDFQKESKSLIEQLINLLEQCEGDFGQVAKLEEYGQTVDRIMGGATSLAVLVDSKSHLIHKIGDYSAICKMVGYKASQIKGNEQFYDICVALLLDATETLAEIVSNVTKPNAVLKDFVSQTLIDRVKWVNTKFSADLRGSVDVKKTEAQRMTQEEIDGLLKKLGLE